MPFDSSRYDEPTTEQWLRLYELAARFKVSAPWKVLTNAHIVGVHDDGSGRTYYCCAMGDAGMEYGLLAFRGESGLAGHLFVLDGAIDQSELVGKLDCVSLNFDSKSCLDARDRELTKQLGVTFTGKRAWPLFRSFTPSHVPWYLTGEDADALALCVEQIEACAAEGRPPIPKTCGDAIVVPLRRRTGQRGHAAWETVLEKIHLPPETMPAPYVASDECVAQLAEKRSEPGIAWEVDFCRLPVPIADKEPPYFPWLLLCCDRTTGIAFPSDVIVPGADEMNGICERLLGILHDCERKPAALYMANSHLAAAFGAMADRSGIALEHVDSLPAVQEFRSALIDSMLAEEPG